MITLINKDTDSEKEDVEKVKIASVAKEELDYHIIQAKKYVLWLRKHEKDNKSKGKRVNKFELSFDFLLNYISSYLHYVGSRYFVRGQDREDMFQDSSILLIDIIEDYSFDSKKGFMSFAQMCVRRKLITKINSGASKSKNTTLNNAKSLDQPIASDSEGHELTLSNILRDEKDDIQDFIDNDHFQYLKNKILSNLTRLEREVFGLYLENYKYSQIADELGIKDKAVDNALTRIKKKIPIIYKDLQEKGEES